MPRAKTKPKPDSSKPTDSPAKPRYLTTSEATSYLQGLYGEFREQIKRYHAITGELLSLEARVELAEKTMCLTRDHLEMTIRSTEDAMPHDWDSALREVRFAGVRLADACMTLLREFRRMTPEELLRGLNNGMFRFRTNSPLREIHASLLKQPSVTRTGKHYVWKGDSQQEMPLRLRIVKKPASGETLDVGTGRAEVKG